MCKVCLLFLLLSRAIELAASFQQLCTYRSSCSISGDKPASFQGRRHISNLQSWSSDKAVVTLSETTTWNLRLVLENLPTSSGGTTSRMFVTRVQFIEDEGYEPPQGILRQVDDEDREEDVGNQQPRLSIKKSRWILSEDPEVRKDSLWIWGLFKDPLYPFLLLQMEVDQIQLPGEEDDSIPTFKVFAQINHKRDKGDVILTPGAELKMKKKETINADPFGAATVDIFEEVSVGKLQLQPIAKS
jgi:hypothetical protein